MTHAVVVGGSIGGLLMARALASRVDKVTVIDRDTPPDSPKPRRGAGQTTQVHALLDSGREAMESLVPGLFAAVESDGGLRADVGEGMHWYHGGFFKIQAKMGTGINVQSRPLLEHHIRSMVGQDPKISLRYGVKCEGLVVEANTARGVRIRNEEGAEDVLSAEIVLLATGRGSQPVKWLEAVGVTPPREEVVPIGIGYAGCEFDGLSAVCTEQPILMLYGTRTKTRRHGLAFQVEGGKVLVTFMGYHGDHPPVDPEQWQAWAASLEAPELARALKTATPTSKVRPYRTPDQLRRHWHKCNLPEGVAVVGDAACALDPLFGQGMSVVALQAAALKGMLEKGAFSTRAAQAQVFQLSKRAWFITCAEASRYPESRPHVSLPAPGVLHWFLDRVAAATSHDIAVYRAFIDVIFLRRDATWLMRPSMLWRIFRPRPRTAKQLQATS